MVRPEPALWLFFVASPAQDESALWRCTLGRACHRTCAKHVKLLRWGLVRHLLRGRQRCWATEGEMSRGGVHQTVAVAPTHPDLLFLLKLVDLLILYLQVLPQARDLCHMSLSLRLQRLDLLSGCFELS